MRTHANKFQLQFQGAIGTVTGSRSLIQFNGCKISIDFGMFQGPREIREKNWLELKDIAELDAIILTHAHIDHSGLLPRLAQYQFQGKIYCSPATLALCEVMLRDSAKLQEEDADFYNERRLSRHEPALPLYTLADVEKILSHFETLAEDQWLQFAENFRFCFHRAGHILGARMVELEIGAKRFIFSGDLGPQYPLLMKEAYQPAETDYLILESTYGDRRIEIGNRKDQLLEAINKVISRGGTLIIPAFAVGRTQEILFLLAQLKSEKKIGPIPIYIDSPMAIDATEIYAKYEDELKPEIREGFFRSPLASAQFRAVRSRDDSMLLCMDTSPKIVISAAGMLTGGRVLHHLRCKLPDEKSGVLFVGYQVPGTKGYLLKNGLSQIRIHKQVVDVQAEIFSIDSLSAHADHNALVAWCRGFRKAPKATFLNHGENDARRTLAYTLKNDLRWLVKLPEENEVFSAYLNET